MGEYDISSRSKPNSGQLSLDDKKLSGSSSRLPLTRQMDISEGGKRRAADTSAIPAEKRRLMSDGADGRTKIEYVTSNEQLQQKIADIFGIQFASPQELSEQFNRWAEAAYTLDEGRESTPEKTRALVHVNQLFYNNNLDDLKLVMAYIQQVEDQKLRETLDGQLIQMISLAGQYGLGSDELREAFGEFLLGGENEATLAATYFNGLGKPIFVPANKDQAGKLERFVDYLKSDAFQFPATADPVVLQTMSDLFVLPGLFTSPEYMKKHIEYLHKCFDSAPDVAMYPKFTKGLKRYYAFLVDETARQDTPFISEDSKKVIQMIQGFINRLNEDQKKAFFKDTSYLHFKTVDGALERLDSTKGSASLRADINQLVELASVRHFKLDEEEFASFLNAAIVQDEWTPRKAFAIQYLTANMNDLVMDIRQAETPELRQEMHSTLMVMLQVISKDKSIDVNTRNILMNAYVNALVSQPISEDSMNMLFDGMHVVDTPNLYKYTEKVLKNFNEFLNKTPAPSDADVKVCFERFEMGASRVLEVYKGIRGQAGLNKMIIAFQENIPSRYKDLYPKSN